MKELEKFNAETTPLGTQLITRDGREVTEWYYFKTLGNSYPLIAAIDGYSHKFTEDGRFSYCGIPNSMDIFIKPKVKEVWANVYMNNNGNMWVGKCCDLKEDAFNHKGHDNYLKTIRITDEPE